MAIYRVVIVLVVEGTHHTMYNMLFALHDKKRPAVQLYLYFFRFSLPLAVVKADNDQVGNN